MCINDSSYVRFKSEFVDTFKDVFRTDYKDGIRPPMFGIEDGYWFVREIINKEKILKIDKAMCFRIKIDPEYPVLSAAHFISLINFGPLKEIDFDFERKSIVAVYVS